MMRTCRPLRWLDVAWGQEPPSRHHLVANRWRQETCPLLKPSPTSGAVTIKNVDTLAMPSYARAVVPS
jgi:hypothetical protein